MVDKFCFGCSKYWKENTMVKVKRGKATRLMCQNCLERRNGTWFGKGSKNETNKVVGSAAPDVSPADNT